MQTRDLSRNSSLTDGEIIPDPSRNAESTRRGPAGIVLASVAKEKLVIIDGYSLLFRAFYGTRFLSTSSGEPTNALFGFVSMLYNILENQRPNYLIIALDAPGNTFRHDEFEEYKATRGETPDEILSQLEFVRDLADAFDIETIELAGYEADDVIGTVVREAKEKGIESIIVTGDLDSLQLVEPGVTVMVTKKGVTDIDMYDPDRVKERYGFGPEHVIDYKAIVGDTSDNIPGVKGIGDKGAKLLIEQFGATENMLEKLDEVPDKLRKKIEESRESMIKSKWLATIDRNAPIDIAFQPYKPSEETLQKSSAMLERLEFRNHLKKLPSVFQLYMDGNVQQISTSVEAVSEMPEIDVLEGIKSADELRSFTSGKEPVGIVSVIESAQLSMFDEEAVYISSGGKVAPVQVEILTELLPEISERLIGHDIKWLFRNSDADNLKPPAFDTALAGYVLQPGRNVYPLKDLFRAHTDFEPSDGDPRSAALIIELSHAMKERLEAEEQLRVATEVEFPLIPILAGMERLGIQVSKDLLKKFSGELSESIAELEADIYRQAGKEFNIGSPKQVGEILFTDMALGASKKTKGGSFSTSADILNELAAEHQIVRDILKWREYTKLRSTYADSLPLMVRSDGRIHTTFNQTVAATGRLSSIEPNLQNIPIRTELGRTIRKAFQSADGYVLGSFDYSQIELRVLAHMCQDSALVSAFAERRDIHSATAALMFHVEEQEVSKEQRRLAKMLNYAVLYGVTAFGLAAQLGEGFGVEDSAELIRLYNSRFPKVKEFTESIVAEARSKGFTKTLLGRRRYFPDIHNSNRNTRMYAERQAMNAPIQGTAADMIKLAMIQVDEVLSESPSRLLLQVHDELVLELSNDRDAIAAPIKEAMESALPLDVPVEVDGKIGPNWLEMEPI